MEEDLDNPLDDELLRELGLEPTPKPAPKKSTSPLVQDGQPQPAPSVKRDRPPPPPPPPPAARPPVLPPASQIPSQEQGEFDQGLAHLTQEMPVQVVAVIGKKTLTLRELVAFKQGEVVELGRAPNESVDLVANGKLIARGELVLIDGKLGIQIKQLVG